MLHASHRDTYKNRDVEMDYRNKVNLEDEERRSKTWVAKIYDRKETENVRTYREKGRLWCSKEGSEEVRNTDRRRIDVLSRQYRLEVDKWNWKRKGKCKKRQSINNY